jgi:hypothetical protein
MMVATRLSSPKSRHLAAPHARQHKDARVFVPEGLEDRSQAIYCLESVQKGIRPVGDGMMGPKGVSGRLTNRR